MIESIGKYVGAKLVTAILTVTVVLIVIWYLRLDDQTRAAIWKTVRLTLLWLGLAAALPWGLFFVPPLVMKAESNIASALMLFGYLAVDVLLALWLAGWHVSSTLAWAVMILGFLCAALYNYIVCDFLAERAEDAC
jgi:hypothetical protein